jgi:hypothetical protein
VLIGRLSVWPSTRRIQSIFSGNLAEIWRSVRASALASSSNSARRARGAAAPASRAANTRPDRIRSAGVLICLAMVPLLFALLHQSTDSRKFLVRDQNKNFFTLKKTKKKIMYYIIEFFASNKCYQKINHINHCKLFM